MEQSIALSAELRMLYFDPAATGSSRAHPAVDLGRATGRDRE
jgi:hypothetical protein